MSGEENFISWCIGMVMGAVALGLIAHHWTATKPGEFHACVSACEPMGGLFRMRSGDECECFSGWAEPAKTKAEKEEGEDKHR